MIKAPHNRKARRKTAIFVVSLLLVLCFGSQSYAQLIPVLGSQRTGTSTAQFLKIGVGARAAGMGNAFIAVGNDATSLYWNPGAITELENSQLAFSHTRWFTDIQHEFVGYVHRLGAYRSIGISAIGLVVDPMEITTEFEPFGTGEYFQYQDIAVGVTYSQKLTDRFSVGGTVRYMQESIAEITMSGVLIDFGTYYWIGAGTGRFAVSMINFAPQFTPEGEVTGSMGASYTQFQSFNPPTLFTVGYASELIQNERHRSTVTLQLNHPNDNSESLNVGTEYAWRETAFLRGGYRFNMDDASFSLGGGVRIPFSGTEFQVDYAYSEYRFLNDVHRFSLKFSY